MSERFEKQSMSRAPSASFATARIDADLQNAIALHERGQLAEAEKLYRDLLKVDPDHFDAQHLLGVLKHRQGRNTEAIELISAALQKKPNEALALSNYGAILSALNRFDEALASFDKAIALKPNYAETHYNRGSALQRLNRFDEALASFEEAIALKPNHAEALNNRAIALQELKRFDEALASFEKAIALKPDYAEALNNRGNALKQLNRLDEALASFDKAIAIQPDYAAAFNNRGNALKEFKRIDEALASFDRAIALKPNFAEALNNRGIALQGLKRFNEALASYDRAIALKPDIGEAFNNRGNVLKELNRFDEALASYDQAIALKPNNAEAFNNRGLALTELGRLAEAQQSTEQAINLAPRRAPYYHTLGNIIRFVAGDPRVTAMEELSRDAESLSPDDRIELHFALAKAYEDLGQPENAFSQLLAGNALKRRQIIYNEATTLGTMCLAQEIFTSEFIRMRSDAGNPSSVPVFIIGMPRSGSTLVEQTLASHPQVFGGGELRYFRGAVDDVRTKLGGLVTSPMLKTAITDEDFREIGTRYLAEIEQLASQAARITDKMTGNFILAGLIHLALPNATIIHTVRDPVDTCVSCFSKLFGEGELSYSYDLAELGRYYRHYQALIAHWHRVLPPGRILDVRYEDVVADLEAQARRIVAHCDLEWDARCLAFHQAERPVRTVSAMQVRQPIYNTAVGRKRVYEQFLNPLSTELGLTSRMQT